jgi:hypothetical protein
MARVAKTTKAAKPAAGGRRTGRAASAAAAKPAPRTTRAAKGSASAAPRRATAPVAAPKLSKDELRTQVEKLERTNATLRAKNRETTRAGKEAAGRIAELEEQVERLEAALEKARAAQAKPARTQRAADDAEQPRRRKRRQIDPGDSVPEGVAVEDPLPLDEEAQHARENLEENLGEHSQA